MCLKELPTSDAMDMLIDISSNYKKPYGSRLNVRFSTLHDQDFVKIDVSFLGKIHCTVNYGFGEYADDNSISFDDFVWEAHKLIHEIGHVRQRLDKFMDINADSNTICMAKQQIICNAFPYYSEVSYYNQMTEIDAEMYSWVETVNALSCYFDKRAIEQSLVNGVKKYYTQPWFADKNISSWSDGFKKLKLSLSQAYNMSWNIDPNEKKFNTTFI